MKPGRISSIETGRIPGMETFKQEMLFGEHITHEEIKRIAKHISNEIFKIRGRKLQPSIQEHIILSLLGQQHMLQLVDDEILEEERASMTSAMASVTPDELNTFIKGIREAIIEEIKKTVDLNDPLFHFISEPHPEKRTIRYLEDEMVYKDYGYDWHTGIVKRNAAALEKLYALKKRSPFILYGLLYKDPNSGDEIQSFQDIQTLDSYIESGFHAPSRNSSFNPLSAFSAFRDAVRAAKFLNDNGLIITDISSDNIGINKKNNTGYLFDFDGLMSKDETPEVYTAKTDGIEGPTTYFPPEFYIRGCRAHEGFSVYELGATLMELVQLVLNLPPFSSQISFVDTVNSFVRLAVAMREPNPEHRLTLEAVEMKMTDLCQKMEAALRQGASQP